MTETNRILTIIGFVVYTILFILVGLYVFIENDESQPVLSLIQWNYFIPVMTYSAFALWVSYGLYLAFRRVLNKVISFAASLIIGIPVGLIVLNRVVGSLM